MIIDVHRHLVVKGTVQGAYIKGASRSFSMMYNKAHKTNLSPRTYIDEVMRKEIDEHADNVIAEMDKAGVDVSVTFGVDYGLAFGEAMRLLAGANVVVTIHAGPVDAIHDLTETLRDEPGIGALDAAALKKLRPNPPKARASTISSKPSSTSVSSAASPAIGASRRVLLWQHANRRGLLPRAAALQRVALRCRARRGMA